MEQCRAPQGASLQSTSVRLAGVYAGPISPPSETLEQTRSMLSPPAKGRVRRRNWFVLAPTVAAEGSTSRPAVPRLDCRGGTETLPCSGVRS